MNPYNLDDDSSHFNMLLHILHSAGVNPAEGRLEAGISALPTDLAEAINRVLGLLKEKMDAQPDWATAVENSSREISSLLRVNDLAQDSDKEVIYPLIEERVERLREMLDHLLENGF